LHASYHSKAQNSTWIFRYAYVCIHCRSTALSIHYRGRDENGEESERSERQARSGSKDTWICNSGSRGEALERMKENGKGKKRKVATIPDRDLYLTRRKRWGVERLKRGGGKEGSCHGEGGRATTVARENGGLLTVKPMEDATTMEDYSRRRRRGTEAGVKEPNTDLNLLMVDSCPFQREGYTQLFHKGETLSYTSISSKPHPPCFIKSNFSL
jgi:hypothetical protein